MAQIKKSSGFSVALDVWGVSFGQCPLAFAHYNGIICGPNITNDFFFFSTFSGQVSLIQKSMIKQSINEESLIICTETA